MNVVVQPAAPEHNKHAQLDGLMTFLTKSAPVPAPAAATVSDITHKVMEHAPERPKRTTAIPNQHRATPNVPVNYKGSNYEKDIRTVGNDCAGV